MCGFASQQSVIFCYRNLAELMDSFVKNFHEQCSSNSDERSGVVTASLVLPCSADLFTFYRKCLVQCISLSTGTALLDLAQLFKKNLDVFCDRVLTANIPK